MNIRKITQAIENGEINQAVEEAIAGLSPEKYLPLLRPFAEKVVLGKTLPTRDELKPQALLVENHPDQGDEALLVTQEHNAYAVAAVNAAGIERWRRAQEKLLVESLVPEKLEIPWGFCDKCRQPIAPLRLLYFPESNTCVSCP